MTEEELRQLVRESLARHAGREAEPPRLLAEPAHTHASHATFVLRSGDEAGACLIEPTVRCNHCGYCLSYGH